MPDRHVVEAFAATVESSDHVGAIERFYAADASTRENQNEPRRGREALAAREAAVLASVAKVETRRLSPIFIDGDHSAIHWRFEFTPKDNGPARVMEEIAVQTWRGNELVAEQFFYDPAQMKG
ncbi:nuclear transport factor 2 family protein [Bradyrhizobium sp.]|uniref:nuclear transport factor 2 family protein n=1 Tax=Bradyrhizobium sp. TaxID=376 RepID=UPI001DAC52AC|nr:nuclear transport factor 2 family protein [Bradyrhizobium sp.]MBI5322508.1 nuclear transport factor 2 family protein [Bradyrhizobium sp.]